MESQGSGTNEGRGRVLWRPPAGAAGSTRLGAYLGWLAAERGRELPPDDYGAVWRWSVEDLDGFWRSVWDHFGLLSSTPVGAALADASMPGARWFPGVELNYATHALRHDDGGPALVGAVAVPAPGRAGRGRRCATGSTGAGPGWPAWASAGATGWRPTCPTSPRP